EMRMLAADAKTASDKPGLWAANKAQYMALRKALAGSSVDANDSLLLRVLSMVASLDGGEPTYSAAAADAVALSLNRETGGAGAVILKKVYDAFPGLVDFPLTVPAIQPLVIKGTFRLTAPEGTTVAVADFQVFELSAEFNRAGADTSQELSHHFDDST